MTYYYWPDKINAGKTPSFDPRERYDIKDERYFIPNHIIDCSLADLLDYPYLDISNGSLLSVCDSNEYWDTHSRNSMIISKTTHCFHTHTFENIKANSPLIHCTYGLSPNALVQLGNTMKIHNGILNHSYVRICPELIFSLSKEMKNELLLLSSDDIEILASDWQKAVLASYEAEEPENVKYFWFGWITVYEHSHYTLEYFTDLLLNIHELSRSCEQTDTIYIAIDY